MHAYRGVMRDPKGERVKWATLVYPQVSSAPWLSPNEGGIAAVSWSPGHDNELAAWMARLLT